MIRKVKQLRFNTPEPPQIRANPMSGIFKNGDEGYSLTFDDVASLLYVKRGTCLRAVHASQCAWVELQLEAEPEPPKK